jgi:hypothetical protein
MSSALNSPTLGSHPAPSSPSNPCAPRISHPHVYCCPCWGKWSSEAFYHIRLGCRFRPRTASALRRKLCNGDLTKTLMLLELCEFCCARTAQPNGADLRCRKCEWLTFGAEGMEEPEAPCVGCASARGWRRPGRDVPKDPT